MEQTGLNYFGLTFLLFLIYRLTAPKPRPRDENLVLALAGRVSWGLAVECFFSEVINREKDFSNFLFFLYQHTVEMFYMGGQKEYYNLVTEMEIKATQNSMMGKLCTQSFTYDEMDRLTRAEANGGTEGTYNSESYTYSSSTGNLASKGGVSYTYGDSDHKHAVTSLSSGWTYQYDQNGNMTERNVNSSTYSLTYDAYNHLISVSGAAALDFVYDGDGQRVKVGGTVYIGDYYRYYGSGYTKFYFANGKRIALRFNTGSQANNYYYLSDHLNSLIVLVTEDRSYISREGYKAWGKTRFGGVGAYKFTSQYYHGSLGLYYYGARWYDPSLGRFTQADTIVPEGVQGSQAWDRYAYVNNNPLRYTDPSGHVLDPGVSRGVGGDGDNFKQELREAIEINHGIDKRFTENLTLSELKLINDDPFKFLMDEDNEDILDDLTQFYERKKTGQQVAAATLVFATDIFVGIPLLYVSVVTGFISPPAIAAEMMETFVVFPINLLGVYLWIDAELLPPVLYELK